MGKKIHTRAKRKLRLAIHKTGRVTKRNPRPKTFKTDSAAKKWAESKKIKDYELIDVRREFSKDKKIKVVVK